MNTLGSGYAPVMRSLVTSLAQSHQSSKASDIGRLYALIGVMEGLGSLVAGPAMAWAFNLGMGWGRAWLGLPYGLAAVLFTCISLVVFWLRVNP